MGYLSRSDTVEKLSVKKLRKYNRTKKRASQEREMEQQRKTMLSSTR